jgi:RNA polymerase sigma factor (TIGR02999 family)
MDSSEVTQLLHEWSAGDTNALDELAPLVYGELHRIAGNFLRAERPGHTLQATALVNEAYLRLVQQDHPEWHSRAHFTAVAAHYMRQILVDYARKRNASKRGAGGRLIALEEAVACVQERSDELLALDAAMQQLGQVSPEKCRVIEMYYFGGMTQDEIAAVLNVHLNTVARHLRMAQAWLHANLSGRP